MADNAPQPPQSHQFTDTYTFEADFRGETLTYLESGFKASMIWTWTTGYRISSSSLDIWTCPDGSHCPVTEEERAEIIRRAVKYAKDVQHVNLIVED